MWKLVLFACDYKLIFIHGENYAWGLAVHNGAQKQLENGPLYSGATAPCRSIYQFLKKYFPWSNQSSPSELENGAAAVVVGP